jgi:uncharacterized membrane protein
MPLKRNLVVFVGKNSWGLSWLRPFAATSMVAQTLQQATSQASNIIVVLTRTYPFTVLCFCKKCCDICHTSVFCIGFEFE